ncbi:MAG: tRNA dihydrouridine synthase DusB [Treponema sp.]|jgi:nifR3 family TIM-barrel protein|nr:tRNA dihydrouridine synthase DusB [Treponema sp.]
MALYRSVTVGSLELPGNLFLAPVAGYSDRAFRSLCVEQGADFSSTELVSAEALSRKPERYGLPGGEKARSAKAAPAAVSLIGRAANEKRYAVQLFGSDPDVMYRAAALLAPLRPDAVDINSGCPVPKVIRTGAGAALMKDPAGLGRIVEAVVRASREYLGGAPVTVKMRSGWDSASINYAECASAALEAGAAMISLHPRTRSQGYSGKSNWTHIADLVSRLPIPVTGSGDLYGPEDAERMLRETGCAAVMFARGAQGNPFIFSAAREFLVSGAWQPADFTARIGTAFRHLELLAADIGERTACLEMRKQFCAYTKNRGKPAGDGPAAPGGVRGLGAAALRNALVRAETIAEYRRILADYL